MWYIYIGIGVYFGLSIYRYEEIKEEHFITQILGCVLTIVLWPIALWNNIE